MTTEEWKTIPSFPEYEASNHGGVRRKAASKYGRQHTTSGISTRPGKDGYRIASVSRDGKCTARPVHTLVYLAFVGEIPANQWVRHLDGDKLNCRLENLELYCPQRNADLVGQVFGEWTVLERAGTDARRNRRWLCRCSCGKEKTVGAIALRWGQSRSCGCKRSEFLIAKVGGEKHYAWKGGINNPGSLAWCNNRLDSLRGSQKRRGSATIVSTPEDVQHLWGLSNGACMACGRSDEETKLHLDHDHATGVVRGFLCDTCNVALGMVNDSSARLRKLAEYVESARNLRIADGKVRAS